MRQHYFMHEIGYFMKTALTLHRKMQSSALSMQAVQKWFPVLSASRAHQASRPNTEEICPTRQPIPDILAQRHADNNNSQAVELHNQHAMGGR